MFIISSELEQDDLLLFNDQYDIIGIDKQKSAGAVRELNKALKDKRPCFLFFATRNYEKIYRVCLICKTSKFKQQIFDNTIEYFCESPDLLIHTKAHKVTYLIKHAEMWAANLRWNADMLADFTEPNVLYSIEENVLLHEYLSTYINATIDYDWTNIQANCDLVKQVILLDSERDREPGKVFIVSTAINIAFNENLAYGVNSAMCSEPVTAGSWIFLADSSKYIYGLLKVARVKPVRRFNRSRFLKHLMVSSLNYDWDLELDVEYVSTAHSVQKPELWGANESAYLGFKETVKEVPDYHTTCIDSDYLKAFLAQGPERFKYLEGIGGPGDSGGDDGELLGELGEIDDDTNYFEHVGMMVEGLKRIYVLSTGSVFRFYNKLTINDEEVIYLDFCGIYGFKVNTRSWDKNILAQFVRDVESGNAYVFLMTAKYNKCFLSFQATNIQKYKSAKDKLFSFSPFTWNLDGRFDCEIAGMNNILPLMFKSKNMWKEFGESVKPYNAIRHVFTCEKDRELLMFSEGDVAARKDMFDYLKSYLMYQTHARARGEFCTFDAMQVATYSDVIEPEDYGLKLKLFWG